MIWDTWGPVGAACESEAKRQRVGEPGLLADPRLADPRLADPRLAAPAAAWPQVAPMAPHIAAPPMAASIFTPPPAQVHVPGPPAGGGPGGSMTDQIMDALRQHAPAPGAAPGAPPCAAPAAARAPGGGGVPLNEVEPALGSMLLNSLRSLIPAGGTAEACQSSGAAQELFRVVQQLGPPALPALALAAPVAAPPAPAPAPAPAPELVLPPPEAPPRHPAPERARRRARAAPLAPPPEEPSPQEDEDEDDGVPHRLPPGFGAIPEDIVEERARQREEQRVLQLKATQPCRFGKRCKKRDCPNAHPEGRDIDTAWNPCAFGRRCKRKGCFYDHPEGRIIDDNPEKGMCKFGIRCGRPDCLYDHPEGWMPLTGPDPRICFYCHDPGHIAGDCPRNPESWAFNREAPGQVVHVGAHRAITAGT